MTDPFSVRFDEDTEHRIWDVVKACGPETSRADIVRKAVAVFLRQVSACPELLLNEGYDSGRDQSSLH